jgi:hypothetical protein
MSHVLRIQGLGDEARCIHGQRPPRTACCRLVAPDRREGPRWMGIEPGPEVAGPRAAKATAGMDRP